MEIFTVVVTDRHSDPDIYTYKSKQFAITNAITLAKKYCRFEDDYEEKELTDWPNGAIFRAEYSCESDNVTVYKTDLL